MDTYQTIARPSEGTYSELRSKFLAFAYPVQTLEEVKQRLAALQKKYYDARHCCYAYRLQPDGSVFRANDAGEPSGTAGRPLLGQIDSRGLTYVLVAVVRYFGGVKLGTSRLGQAYKEAASQALAAAEVKICTVDTTLSVAFPYERLNDVMRVVKEMEPRLLQQQFDTDCTMTLSIRQGQAPLLHARLEKVEGLTFCGEATESA